MPLIDLKTDLKSLKYGNDRPGGGSSDQPYIKTDINKVDTGFNRFRLTTFDDGLIRGGIVRATNSSVVDAIRIGKFFTDLPKGPLFIVKQIGLQLTNPRIESKKLRTDNPTTGGGLLRNVGNFILNTANKIVNAVGPTRIYNLGINTLAQVPVNAFGQHFNRHGLLPVQNEDTKYISVVANNNYGNNNRLVGLKTKFELGDGDEEISKQFNLRDARRTNREANSTGRRNNRLVNRSLRQGARTEGFEFNRLRYKRQKLDTTTLTIDSYIGGPNSLYGVGRTIINRYAFTEDKGRIEEARNRNYVSQTLPTISLGKTWDYEISTFTNSALSANPFKLDSDTTVVSGSFQNFIASKNDPTSSRYTAAAQEASASQRIKSFISLSNYTGSIFSSNQFLGLKNNTPSTLINYVASKDDPKDSKYKAAAQEASASQRVKDFTGASQNTKSTLSSTLFPGLQSNTPPTLVNYVASTADINASVGNGSSAIVRNDLGVSKEYFSGSAITTPTSDATTYSNIVRYDIPLQTNGDKISATTEVGVQSRIPIRNASYESYKKIIESKKLRERTFTDNGVQTNAFGIYGNNNYDKIVGGVIGPSTLPDSTEKPVYSNGQNVIRLDLPWNKITREIRVGSGRQDEINLTPLFDNGKYFGGNTLKKENDIRDLVRFRIQAVDGDSPDSGKWMVFRAYLTDLSDNSQATWNDVKYAGRGDRFYIYDGFTRKINVSFKVAALSEQEMKFIYQKLNFLMSNTMPDYKDGFLMRGPLVRLSIGNWIDSQVGILGSVNFKIPQDSPWEISLDDKRLILPHIVEVSMDFTPIGSESRGGNSIAEKSTTTSHIAQNNTEDLKLQYIN